MFTRWTILHPSTPYQVLALSLSLSLWLWGYICLRDLIRVVRKNNVKHIRHYCQKRLELPKGNNIYISMHGVIHQKHIFSLI